MLRNMIIAMVLAVIVLIVSFQFIEVKQTPGIYFILHENGIEEYLILKPDNYFEQVIVYGDNEIQRNRGEWSKFHDNVNHCILLQNYISGKSYYNMGNIRIDYHSCCYQEFPDERKLSFDEDLDIFWGKISTSYNVDSLIGELQ